jgi:hypothetical protein
MNNPQLKIYNLIFVCTIFNFYNILCQEKDQKALKVYVLNQETERDRNHILSL